MKLKLYTSLFLLLLIIITTSCNKEGVGGKASISGHVKHHETNIPNAVVYIKYGAKEFPGNQSTDYDQQTVASSGDAHFEFEELYKGDYYIYSEGFDSTISEIVLGGIPVKLKTNSESVEVDVPVTE